MLQRVSFFSSKRGQAKARGVEKDSLAILLLEGEEMIDRTAALHRSEWGLGTAKRWDIDQRRGIISWTFEDRIAEAPVQVLGSWNAAAGTWRWAWADHSVSDPLAEASARVREWGAERDHPALSRGLIETDEEGAATLATLAFRISGATGFYRGGSVYLTFGAVTIDGPEGGHRTVSISLNE